VVDGQLLWEPDAQWCERTHLVAYLRWLERERGLRFDDYDSLWRWSVRDLAAFWGSVWDRFDVRASAPPERVLAERRMPGARWFPGARLNYAEHILRWERPGTSALLWCDERNPLTGMSWDEFAGAVRGLAVAFRDLGVRRGDRVVGYLPNIPESIIAMLATASVGAVWASCSPDFGAPGAVDRLHQLDPVVLFTVDGYVHRSREIDRAAQAREIVEGLPGLRHVVSVPNLGRDGAVPGALSWTELLDRSPVPAEGFRFEQVPFDHPLWILFSSGTSGPPKAIVHGHGGILLEQLKLQQLHMDLHPGDRVFLHSTTSWMMWNFLASSLLSGACPVLYEGSPVHPDVGVFWRIVQDAKVSFFATSPSYVDVMTRSGAAPKQEYDLSALRTIMPVGAPASARCSAWFYDDVKRDLWLATGSGATECCTGLVGGVPILPVYAGEIQARSLGVAAYAFDDHGREVVGEVGELVITEPMPSMPIRLWGDEDGSRYRESYLDRFPGVWRQGDFFLVNERGGCFVLGRSDAVLNRHGVRIGPGEIYRALADLPEIEDSLVVNVTLPERPSFMPLFVKPAPGHVVDDRLRARIRDHLRHTYTPRHVPDVIVEVSAIPRTISGKKMEIPVRRILQGTPVELAADRDAMADPAALDAFAAYARICAASDP
jgi:acetoacetyl-CoA synthetase